MQRIFRFFTALILTAMIAACASPASKTTAPSPSTANTTSYESANVNAAGGAQLPPQSYEDGASSSSTAVASSPEIDTSNQTTSATYDKETIVGVATKTLGAGTKEVASVIESLFSRFGRPNAYISGSEAGGGLIIGLRYGGGTLSHKIEGATPIHWTGPSIGLDFGADAVKSFALVYNVHDAAEIYRRIGAVEGGFYYIGGMGVSIYRGKDSVVAMVRLGAGLRAQATVGYIKFTQKRSLLPF